MKYNIVKYISILNYYTGISSQSKTFLEIHAPKKISKIIKKYKWMSSFFGYRKLKTCNFTDFCSVQNFPRSVLRVKTVNDFNIHFVNLFTWHKCSCKARNRTLECSYFSFCKDIKYKMVADVKSRRSSFIMYVNKSRSVNSSMF